jgi:ABC-type dipeptide/oligopeptide/nickel transport system permease component
MLRFIVRRFIYALLLLFVASVLIFSGLRVAPGDVTGALVSVTGTTEITIRNVRERLALDEPLATQYATFLKNVLSGDPGNSFISGARISDMIRDSGARTLKLGLAALILTYALAIPLGVLAAWSRNSPQDQGVRFLAVLGMGIPNFFLAVLLIQLFAVKLQWLPVAGSEGFKAVILPAVVLAIESMAINMRLMRSSMLEELSKDYVRTLKAKGLSTRRVIWVHGLRNALVPVIAFAGIVIPLILGYTLIVEVIFRFEGIGFQLVQAIETRDYLLAQTLALLFTAIVIFSNFLADVGHQLIDPRVREQARTA